METGDSPVDGASGDSKSEAESGHPVKSKRFRFQEGSQSRRNSVTVTRKSLKHAKGIDISIIIPHIVTKTSEVCGAWR
jgi:hypothetical protein